MKNLKTLFLMITLIGTAFSPKLYAAAIGESGTIVKRVEKYDFSKPETIATEAERYQQDAQKAIDATRARSNELEREKTNLTEKEKAKTNKEQEIENEQGNLYKQKLDLQGNLNNFKTEYDNYQKATNPEDAANFSNNISKIAEAGKAQIDAINADIKTKETDLGSQEVIDKDTTGKEDTKIDVKEETGSLGIPGETAPGIPAPEAPTIQQERTSYIKKVVDFLNKGINKVLSRISDTIENVFFGKEEVSSYAQALSEANTAVAEDAKINNKLIPDAKISEFLTGQERTLQEANQLMKEIIDPKESLSPSENTTDLSNDAKARIENISSDGNTITNKEAVSQVFKNLKGRASAFEVFKIEMTKDFTDPSIQQSLKAEYDTITNDLNKDIRKKSSTFEKAEKNYSEIQRLNEELKAVQDAYEVLTTPKKLAEEIQSYTAAKNHPSVPLFENAINRSREGRKVVENASYLTEAAKKVTTDALNM